MGNRSKNHQWQTVKRIAGGAAIKKLCRAIRRKKKTVHPGRRTVYRK